MELRESFRELYGGLSSMAVDPRQIRLDVWNRARERVDALEAARSRGEDTTTLYAELAQEFQRAAPFERLWIYPGRKRIEQLVEDARARRFDRLAGAVRVIAQNIGHYGDEASLLPVGIEPTKRRQHYFTTLVLDTFTEGQKAAIRERVMAVREDDPEFVYDLLFVDNAEDALLAILFNDQIQACVVGCDFAARSAHPLTNDMPGVAATVSHLEKSHGLVGQPRAEILAEAIAAIRPHVDRYLVADEAFVPRDDRTERVFRRLFYRYDNAHELHMTLLEGVRDRYATPFFDALRAYAARPIGNFHALPIARGGSILNSRWITDMADFYGVNVFMAESSSTSGGLDSLLEPVGVIDEAQKKAARAFGSDRTYFVTNGTSTANKIALQALAGPGDVVLIDRNCHKSHHYGLLMTGARPVYLDAYPLQPYAIYGGVPLRRIKQALFDLKRAGRLDAVKLVILTNCTFDGVTYNPLRVMEEILAIKPDVAFLWDEAWYAFATFHPTARGRTAMWAARTLEEKLASDAYRREYEEYRKQRPRGEGREDDAAWLDRRLMPDPDRARVRVYSTHSTHKSLSAFRQGSMIHVRDQDFDRKAADAFEEAYFTHTSTSPNYQIIASLDIARRQMELEGFGLTRAVYQRALMMRDRVKSDPLLAEYFRILEPEELIPAEFRASGFRDYTADADDGASPASITSSWAHDEFVIDPTRLTLYLGETGYDGDAFKKDALMGRHGIQVNKTSINSVLMIATIGATWGSLRHLLDVLRLEAERVHKRLALASDVERRLFEASVRRHTTDLPPLPDFSAFHDAFRPHVGSPEGNMRGAFYLGTKEENREYVPLGEAIEMVRAGRELVSTNLVVPYPPGFPVLVPGQVVSLPILEFLQKLDVREIHGYRADIGLSVFGERVLTEARGVGDAEPLSRPADVARRREIRIH